MYGFQVISVASELNSLERERNSFPGIGYILQATMWLLVDCMKLKFQSVVSRTRRSASEKNVFKDPSA